MRRGEVVIVDFPYTDSRASKIRPALIVQNDLDNANRRKTIVALITGNLRMVGDPNHRLVDPGTPDGAGSGLHGPSLVSCNSLYTVEQDGIIRSIGRLSPRLMQQADACLKAALAL
jgi:mRNA interferase MazF